jgi:hypothetical protein
MKAKNIILTIVLVLVCVGTGLASDTDSNDARPYIGVMLDGAPLPDLLVKHLGLEPGQGIRIVNIHRDSPADKAELERDDIIIGFQGGDVNDQQQFVDDVRRAGIGTEVSLEIIHLGKRKTVTLKLEGLKGDFDMKYPPEPEIVQSWRPGKIFKLKPGDEDWMEVFRDNMPSDVDVNIKKFFKELYTYKHSSDGEDYTVILEGNPNDVESTITVKIGKNEYKTTLKEIDKLPEKYQKAAQQAIKDARKVTKTRKFDGNFPPQYWPKQFDWRPYVEKMRPDFMPFGPGNEMFDRIEKQMREMRKRLDALEKWHKDTFDPDGPDEQEFQEQKDSPPRDKESEQLT